MKLSWIINEKCNLNCIHCYSSSGNCDEKELSEEKFELLYNSLSSVKIKKVFISGGEPLLSKNLFNYLKISKKLTSEVSLCTNGTKLSEEMLDKLIEYGLNGIVISLQTLKSEKALAIYKCDKVVDEVLKAIKLVQSRDLKLSVEMTIMKQNYMDISEYIDILSKYGVKSFSFKRLMPVGRVEQNEVALTPKENYDVLKTIFDIRNKRQDIFINVHDPLYGTIMSDYYKNDSQDNSKFVNGYSCKAGTRWIGVGPDGDVSPCPLMLYKDQVIGNVYERSLNDILKNSDIVQALKNLMNEDITSCRYKHSCLGCRVTALSMKGDIYAQDSMCVHNNERCPYVSRKT